MFAGGFLPFSGRGAWTARVFVAGCRTPWRQPGLPHRRVPHQESANMKRIIGAMALAAGISLACPAEAQVSIDLKVGLRPAHGRRARVREAPTSTEPMTNCWSGAIPIEVAGRYRFCPNFSAGVYFQYGPAIVASRLCTSGMTCSGVRHAGRRGGRLRIPARSSFLNPWVSLGTGWQWTHFSIATSTRHVEASASDLQWMGVLQRPGRARLEPLPDLRVRPVRGVLRRKLLEQVRDVDDHLLPPPSCRSLRT